MSREYFTRIPNRILNNKRLNKSCVMVYAFVFNKTYYVEGEYATFSNSEISKYLKISTQTVENCFVRLKDEGIISIVVNPPPKNRRITFLVTPK